METYGFIVEGVHDKDKVSRLVRGSVFVVAEGQRYNNRVANGVRKMVQDCTYVYILTDPDETGDKLADMVWKDYPTMGRIYMDPEQCLCERQHKMKIGVEHATDAYLREVFERYGITVNNEDAIERDQIDKVNDNKGDLV